MRMAEFGHSGSLQAGTKRRILSTRACTHLNTYQREDLNQSSVAAIAIPAA